MQVTELKQGRLGLHPVGLTQLCRHSVRCQEVLGTDPSDTPRKWPCKAGKDLLELWPGVWGKEWKLIL